MNLKVAILVASVIVGVSAVIGAALLLLTGESETAPETEFRAVTIGEPVAIELPAEKAATVTHESGARIQIPAGATTDPTTVSVAEVEPPESKLDVRRAFDFSVGDVELLQPVTIHIPFELKADEDASEIIALHRNEELGDWEVVPGEVDSASRTIAVTTLDLSIYSTTGLSILVEVDATCDVSSEGITIDENTGLSAGAEIKVSSNVRAIKTPPRSNINVYMKPYFTEDIRGYELPDDTDAKSEVRNIGPGDEATLSYTGTIDRPGTYAFSCRIFWERLGPDQELINSALQQLVVTVGGYGEYNGGEHSVLRKCWPSIPTPLVGESVDLITAGHRLSGAPPVNYYSGRLYPYHRGEVKERFFRARQFDSFIGPDNLPLVSAGYTFDSAGSYTLDCELFTHVTGLFRPPPDPFASMGEKLLLGFQQLYEKWPIDIRSYQGVMTSTFEVAETRWGDTRPGIVPQSLPEEGGDISVKMHTHESKGTYVSAPTIEVSGIESGRPMSECRDEPHEVDRGGYVARAWCASFAVPPNTSTDRIAAYTVKVSSAVDVVGSVSASISVARTPPPPPPPPSVSDREMLLALYRSTSGARWKNNVQGNQPWLVDNTTSAIGDWYGITTTNDNLNRVRRLILEANCLRGSLPPEIGRLVHLDTLILTGNNRDGCGDLEGRIPDSVGFLTNLTLLDLSNNNLSGEIPDAFGNTQSKLQELYLADNRLSGEIPSSIGNLKALYYLDLRNNRLEGQIPATLADLPNLEELYLSGGRNEFTGCIPAALFDIDDHDLSELDLETCDEMIVDMQHPPDLVVHVPSVSYGVLAPGDPFTLSATVGNVGTGESSGSTLRYYRSTNDTIDWGDTQVATDSVEALDASATRSYDVPLTAPPDAGTYYYGVCVDSVLDESDTTNNCSSSVMVTVSAAPQKESGTSTTTGKFTSVSAGDWHTCGVREDSSVACWGSNYSNQGWLPEGEFASVSAGNLHTCGIRLDGSIACWGFNDDGRITPFEGEFASVSSGFRYSCGLRRDGYVACWGRNVNNFGPTIPPEAKFASISAGKFHACGVRLEGYVACWGRNWEGEATPPDGEFTSVSSGQDHTCGVRLDGSRKMLGNQGQAAV